MRKAGFYFFIIHFSIFFITRHLSIFFFFFKDDLWKKISRKLEDFKDSVQQPLFDQIKDSFEVFHDNISDGFIQESYENVDERQKQLNSPIIKNLLKTVTRKLEDENNRCVTSVGEIFENHFTQMKSGILESIRLHENDLKDQISKNVRSHEDINWGNVRSWSGSTSESELRKLFFNYRLA